MKYIELPEGVTSFQTDEKGYRFFQFQSQNFYFSDIVAKAKNQLFEDKSYQISLSVSDKCPNENKFYVEYLPTGKPNCWCKVHNGQQKNKDLHRYLQNQSWLNSPEFNALNTQQRGKVMAARQEQKEHRYTKDLKSW